MMIDSKQSSIALLLMMLICALWAGCDEVESVNRVSKASRPGNSSQVSSKSGFSDELNSRDIWLSNSPRGTRKGFSIFGVRPGDNIEEVQAVTQAPLEFRLQDEGLAEIYHPKYQSILRIGYEPATGEIQAIDIHQKLAFEKDGKPVQFSEDSFESCEKAISEWAHPNRPNVCFDDQNELIVYPIAPGNHIGFISLSAKGKGSSQIGS